jgi:hypothetical protein
MCYQHKRRVSFFSTTLLSNVFCFDKQKRVTLATLAKTLAGLQVECRLLLFVVNKREISRQILVKLSKIIFHEKPFSGSRVTPEVLKPFSSTSTVAVLLLASEHRHKMSLELPKIKLFKDQYAVSKENRGARKHHFETRHLDNRQTDMAKTISAFLQLRC